MIGDIPWETVYNGGAYEQLERMRVEGGWLYRTKIRTSLAMAFVPEKPAPKKTVSYDSVIRANILGLTPSSEEPG
jgi:hypothetical protein